MFTVPETNTRERKGKKSIHLGTPREGSIQTETSSQAYKRDMIIWDSEKNKSENLDGNKTKTLLPTQGATLIWEKGLWIDSSSSRNLNYHPSHLPYRYMVGGAYTFKKRESTAF